MTAIIRTGGKQYRVAEGDVIHVEKLEGGVGETITFDDVLSVGDGADLRVGTPKVDGATVQGTILAQGRAKKVIVFKFKRRKNYQRKKGHRQYFTRIRITSVKG